MFIAVQLFSIVFIYLWFPETRGRLLEEIGEIFDGPGAALKTQARLHEDTELKQDSSRVEEAGYESPAAA